MIDIHDKHLITRSFGGYSPCIQGNTKFNLRPFNGSVVPNCVGYGVGAYNFYADPAGCSFLGNRNAKELYDLGVSQGLPHGKEPKAKALIVWSNKNAGHCAIVEEVINDTTIRTTESGWNYTTGPIIREVIRKKVNGSWEYPGGTFIGFIYQPEEEIEMITFYAYTGGVAIKDPEVLRLQILLNGLQGSKLVKDSSYGPATTKAVKKWQADHGISATGTCDKVTWNSILGIS